MDTPATHQPSAHHLAYIFPDSRTIAPEENHPNPNSKPSPKPSPNPNRGRTVFFGEIARTACSPFSFIFINALITSTKVKFSLETNFFH